MLTYPYVSRIAANIKQIINEECYPKTIYVGPNGSGKSSRTDAVALALTGAVRISGKDVRMPIDLMKLKSRLLVEEDAPLSVMLKIQTPVDVQFANYICIGSTAKATRPKHTFPAFVSSKVLPIRAMDEAFMKSQDELRDLFMAVCSDSITYGDILMLLEGIAKEEYAALHHDLNSDTPGGSGMSNFQVLEMLLEKAEKEKKIATASVKRFDAELNASGVVTSPPSEVAIKSAEAALEDLEGKRDAISRQIGAVEQEIRAVVMPTQQQAASNALPKHGMWSVANELKLVLSAAIKNSVTKCPMCGVHHSDSASGIYKERLVAVEAKLRMASQMPAAASPVKPNPVPVALAEKKQHLLNMMESARRSCDEMREKLITLREARVAYENAASARKIKAKAATDVDTWNRIAQDLQSAIDSLLERGVKSVEQRVQKYLPSRYTFGVRLNAGDRRICHIGFRRSDAADELDTAISDGERAILLVALALALSEDVEFKVIIPPDCSMDAETLALFLEATVDAPAQILLSSTTMPARVPDGWHVVQLGGDIL